jgi:hypothetical protein
MHFLLSKFQGSNLDNFSHHGLMENVTILVMGPMLGFNYLSYASTKLLFTHRKHKMSVDFVAKKL